MNWLKAMLLMVVLGAILYGVNLVLNKSAPVQAPANDGNWSSEGPIAPPAAGSAAPGPAAGEGYLRSSYGQTPAGQQPASSSVYGSGNYATGNYSAGNSANAPPASPNSYGQISDPGKPNAGVPAADAATGPPPPTADQSRGNQPDGYQPATPTVVNSDPTHAGISATPVGLVTNSPATPASSAIAGNPATAPAFTTVMDNVVETLREGHLAEGLQRLTLMYDDPKLDADQTKQLNDLLGRLAGTVVYSRQHLLLPPYEIKPGDRLETIADEYQIPAALLAKINGIADPDHLPAGQKLKVMRGPFMALVNLNAHEVTLVVQQCYAGRFTLSGVGRDAAALKGVFKIDRKSFDVPNHPSDLARQGAPTFSHWISFSDQQHEAFGFCGLSAPNAGDEPQGLMLNPSDAEDLFDILSVGSSIVMR